MAEELVERDDDLAIAVGAEAIAARLEFGTQLTIVVDFAVADQPDRAVGVYQWLTSALEIDD